MPNRRPSPKLSDSTYLELVRSLSNSLVPSAIMNALFVIVAGVTAIHADNATLTALAIIGSLMAVTRLFVLLKVDAMVCADTLNIEMARRAETMFSAIYLTFAIILGAYAAVGLAVAPLAYHVPLAAMVVGFGAGVASGVALRPWIAIPALVVAVGPAALVSLAHADEPHVLLALLLTAFSAGGIGSMLRRYRTAVQMIEMRQLFSVLARHDALTGLSNRLSLEDAFASAIESSSGGVVVHLLDLDRFKPVNDVHGHPIGDLLLKAVAGRLERLVREGDLVARIGGDEFAILQTSVSHPGEAELMARRIAQKIGEPYTLTGHNIEIGASVGWASSAEHGTELAHLLEVADKSLYDAKRRGRPPRALAG